MSFGTRSAALRTGFDAEFRPDVRDANLREQARHLEFMLSNNGFVSLSEDELTGGRVLKKQRVAATEPAQ